MPDTRQNIIAPSLSIAKEFWTAFAGDPDAPIYIRFIPAGGKGGYVEEYRGTLDELWPLVREHQALHDDVYFIANEPRPEAYINDPYKQTKDADIGAVRVMMADFDKFGGLPQFHIEPHFLNHTSTVPDAEGRMVEKFQAFWLVDGAPADKSAYKAAQQRLAEFYDSDRSVVNIARVMRLPGSLHHKGHPDNPQLVTIAKVDHFATPIPFDHFMAPIPATKREEKPQTEQPAGEEDPVSRDYLRSYVLAGINPNRPRNEWRDILFALNNTPVIPTPGVNIDEWKRMVAHEWMRGELYKGEFEEPADAQYRGVDDIDHIMRNEIPRGPGEERCSFRTLAHFYNEDNERYPYDYAFWKGLQAYTKAERLHGDGSSAGGAEGGPSQSDDGPTTPPPPPDEHAEGLKKLIHDFRDYLPSEEKRRPPPRYWDTDARLGDARLFMHVPQSGAYTLVYAAYSKGKTTFVLNHLLHIAKVTGARICYVLGEGVGGFGPKTIAACQQDWNKHNPQDPMTDEWLDAHLRLVVVAPNLMNELHIEAMVAARKDFKPNILVIDTLGSAVAGENLNDPGTGTKVGKSSARLAANSTATASSCIMRARTRTRARRAHSTSSTIPKLCSMCSTRGAIYV